MSDEQVQYRIREGNRVQGTFVDVTWRGGVLKALARHLGPDARARRASSGRAASQRTRRLEDFPGKLLGGSPFATKVQLGRRKSVATEVGSDLETTFRRHRRKRVRLERRHLGLSSEDEDRGN